MPPYSFQQLVDMRQRQVREELEQLAVLKQEYANRLEAIIKQERALLDENSEDWVRKNDYERCGMNPPSVLSGL